MTVALDATELAGRGAVHLRAALADAAVVALESALSDAPTGTAGVRLAGIAQLPKLLSAPGGADDIASLALNAAAFPVRAVLFDKGPENNWGLGWHQDRTIVVRHRHEVDGFGPWTVKAGLQHVAPPFEILESMVTMRIHFDPVDQDNAPLLIIPGSHLLGRLSETEVKTVAEQVQPQACLAARGDTWLYSTPILHASRPATKPTRRRVLQIDYASRPLPGGLEWLGL